VFRFDRPTVESSPGALQDMQNWNGLQITLFTDLLHLKFEAGASNPLDSMKAFTPNLDSSSRSMCKLAEQPRCDCC